MCKCDWCGQELCDHCGECHMSICREYEDPCDWYSKQCELKDVQTQLSEATELLKAWKELPWNAMSRSLISAHHLKKKQELDERTASFLEKEGKNEAR